MSDPNSPEARAELESNRLHLWVGDPEIDLMCPKCNLPGAWRVSIDRDPAMPGDSYYAGCFKCGERSE